MTSDEDSFRRIEEDLKDIIPILSGAGNDEIIINSLKRKREDFQITDTTGLSLTNITPCDSILNPIMNRDFDMNSSDYQQIAMIGSDPSLPASNQTKDYTFWKNKTWCFGSVLNCSEDRPEKRSKFSNFPIIKVNQNLIEENGTSALQILGKYDPLEKDNVGFKLLQKMGWTSSKGLGKNENGILEPLEIQYNKSTHGLGVLKKEKKVVNLIHHCEVCNTNVSDSAWQAHINGKKHRKNQDSRNNIQCQVCNITLDVNAWASHIAGKKHAKKLQLKEQQARMALPAVNRTHQNISPQTPTGYENQQFYSANPTPGYIPPQYMVIDNHRIPYVHPAVIRMLQGNTMDLRSDPS
jgi:hypothetical protein